MRVKRQKKNRRAVRFFATCFGFRLPFKVLCDGTFVHHLISQDIKPADKAISDVLGGNVKLFTTSCVIGELEYLGYETHKKNKKKSGNQDGGDQIAQGENPYLESCRAARKLGLARCGHEKRIGAEACIMEVIGADNPEHFFVATQDAEMRHNLQQIPGVPVLYGLHKAIFLESPSAFQKEFAAASEEKRLLMTTMEHKLLKKRVDKDSVPGGGSDGELTDNDNSKFSSRQHGKQNVDHRKKSLGVSDKPQFKRKKAKAPNPLSCKKKKVRTQEDGATKNGNKDNADGKRSRSRTRKRSRKGNTSIETNS